MPACCAVVEEAEVGEHRRGWQLGLGLLSRALTSSAWFPHL